MTRPIAAALGRLLPLDEAADAQWAQVEHACQRRTRFAQTHDVTASAGAATAPEVKR